MCRAGRKAQSPTRIDFRGCGVLKGGVIWAFLPNKVIFIMFFSTVGSFANGAARGERRIGFWGPAHAESKFADGEEGVKRGGPAFVLGTALIVQSVGKSSAAGGAITVPVATTEARLFYGCCH